MNEANTRKILEACPILYRGRSDSPQNNLMCFGFECDDGWFDLVYNASVKIETLARAYQQAHAGDEEALQ